MELKIEEEGVLDVMDVKPEDNPIPSNVTPNEAKLTKTNSVYPSPAAVQASFSFSNIDGMYTRPQLLLGGVVNNPKCVADMCLSYKPESL